MFDVAFHTAANFLTASVRYRAGVAAKALRARGLKVYVGPTYVEAGAHVYLKHFGDHVNHLDDGVRVFDVTDNHYDSSKLSDFYHKMSEKCHYLSTNSSAMYELIRKRTGKDARVILDPWIYPKLNHRPRKNPKSCLWFGHSSNFESLKKLSPYIPKEMEVFTIIADKDPELSCAYKFVPWGLSSVEEALRVHEVGVITSSKPEASENRILECLNAGITVWSDNVCRSYDHLNMWITRGEPKEFPEWWRRVMKNPRRYREKAEEFKGVAECWGPERAGKLWAEFLESLL